jgi:hypothetical protein
MAVGFAEVESGQSGKKPQRSALSTENQNGDQFDRPVSQKDRISSSAD